jgi:hypothetical protein
MWQLAVMGYTDVVKRVKAQKSGDNAVYLEVRAEPNEVQSILRLASRLIKNNTRHLGPRPGDLLPLPDAGTDADGGDAADTSDASADSDVAEREEDALDSAVPPDRPPRRAPPLFVP